MREPRYYVRRIECWGGTFVFAVADRETRRQVSKTFNLRKSAESLAERMEADRERYESAMLDKAVTG